MNVTPELIEEFAAYSYGEDNIPDPDIEPKQVLYHYKLFLLERGYYGLKPTTTNSELVPGCNSSTD